jgi:hypothetical protein
MFAPYKTSYCTMNHSAKNSASGTSHMMGCSGFMMSSMPMIMRQPSCGVLNHIV